MIIIVTLIVPISLKIQAQRCNKQKIILCNHKREQVKSSLEHGTAKQLWWKTNFKQICFEFFFIKGGYSFRRFNCNRVYFQTAMRSSVRFLAKMQYTVSISANEHSLAALPMMHSSVLCCYITR